MLGGHQLSFLFLVVVLLFCQTHSTVSSSPWYCKDFAVSPPLYRPGFVVLDAAGNSTHLYVLDQWFYVHLFRFSGTSGAAVYDSYSDYYDQDSVYENWTELKSAVDVKIALNPYNSQLYMLKYTVGTTKPFIVVYRFPSTSIVSPISSYKYSTTEYFNTTFVHPRLKIEFDSSNVYISHHNDPQRSSVAGYFIAKLTHSLAPVANITSSTLGALSITFFCHQSPKICVWTTNQSVTEYWMSNYTVRQTYNLGPSPTTINFNPRVVESDDGSFSYYLHHNVMDNSTVVLHKKDGAHTAVTNASIQLSYNMSLPPPEAYDLIMSNSGDIIAGMMTAPNPAAGVGEQDIAIFKYLPTLQLQSQFILSTALQDNITKLFLPDGDGNKIVICGSTDGSLNSTLPAAVSRRAFVARFEYFYVSNVSTKFQNLVEPGEVINITFSNIPPGALSGIPVVQFNQQPCTDVKWTGFDLSSMIPRGLGGPFELSVQFNYLPHKPSVSFQNLSYVLPPVLLDVEPKQGPAAGYNVTLIGANIYPDDNSISVYIGAKLCIDVKHVNATVITCRTPPGTGRNISVILSNTGVFNSSERVDISYDPPVISQISPLTVATNGSALAIKGYNFGPCSESPCAFSNITVTIGSFGSCTNGIHINDTDLQCNTPEGFGANVAAYVTVNGQNSTNSIIAYRKPEIWVLNPSGSASRNPTVYIDGVNFGGLSAPRVVTFQDVVTLQNYSCPEVNWLSHQRIYCQFSTVDLPLSATLNVTVVVGSQSSDLSTKSVFRTGIINDPPIAVPLNVSIFEDQFVILQFDGSDPNVDDSVTMYITSNPVNGTLFQLSISGKKGALIDTVSGPIAVTHFAFRVLYIPHKDFNGNDTFSFKARDVWNTDSSIQTAQINVVSVPDPPIPQRQVYEMNEDTELSFNLNTTDPDTAKSEQVVIILSLPLKGSLFMLSNSNGTSWSQISAIPQVLSLNVTLKYQPFSNMYGTDTFDYMANDGYFNSSSNGTITFRVNPVNDPPYLNITNLNLTIYEDTETVFQFDISDIDINDKLTVKITGLHINGSIYFRDLQRGTTVLLGEGSDIKGPPYEVLYIPTRNFFTSTSHDIQKFNITYADAISAELSHQISFPVLAVNDPPVLLCSTPQIELPTTFVVGMSRNHSFTFQASDVDNTNFTYILASAPRQGALKTANGHKLLNGSSFDSAELIFDAENRGGGYPYSNFTIFVMDPWNSTSNNCTFVFTFSCPLGLYNNIFFNETGEICAPCPSGAVCSTDGKIPPRPQYGWWRTDNHTAFLPCFPAEACPGTANNACAYGYKGIRCAECAENHYRLGDSCYECRLMNVIPSIVALIAFTAVLIFFYVLRRMKIFGSGFALINILINFLQTVWLLRKVRLDWPPELLSLIDYLNLLNFNIELVAPECIIQSPLNFSQKMRIVLALPIVLFILAIFLMLISKFFESNDGTRRRGTQNSVVKYLTSGDQYGVGDIRFRWGLMKIFNIALSILYVNIASKSLSFFDCSLEDDGRSYLDEEVSLVCYASWWYQDLPLGVLAVIVYVIGIPTYFAILYFLSYQTKHQGNFWEQCRKNSRGIMHGDGDFKPEFQYFIVVQFTHKLAIVTISLFFSRYAGLQIVLTIISLLAILMANVKCNPYVHATCNTLEKMSVICSILVLAFGLPFRIDNFQIPEYRTALIIIILSVIFGFVLTVIGAALNDIRRSLGNGVRWRRSKKKITS